jgi:glyoxalase family protein
VIDPHGLRLALVEASDPHRRVFTPWEGSPVDADHQIRGLHGAQLWERQTAPTTAFLTEVLGFELLGSERGWARYGFRDAAGVVDVLNTPEERRGAWGSGCVHHLAWRVDDERQQLLRRARIEDSGARPTPVIDRFWFKSVYFKEPGGVLFEMATDGPGFVVDEDPAHLGETLVLPPWLEAERATIEAALPPVVVRVPSPAGAAE